MHNKPSIVHYAWSNAILTTAAGRSIYSQLILITIYAHYRIYVEELTIA